MLWRWGILRHKRNTWAPPLIRIEYTHLHVNTDLLLLHYVPTKDNEGMLEIRSAVVPVREREKERCESSVVCVYLPFIMCVLILFFLRHLFCFSYSSVGLLQVISPPPTLLITLSLPHQLRTHTHTLLSAGDVNFGQHSRLLTNSPLPASHVWELLGAGGGHTDPITEPQPGGVYVTNMDARGMGISSDDGCNDDNNNDK